MCGHIGGTLSPFWWVPIQWRLHLAGWSLRGDLDARLPEVGPVCRRGPLYGEGWRVSGAYRPGLPQVLACLQQLGPMYRFGWGLPGGAG
jgi:hypothetical protein